MFFSAIMRRKRRQMYRQVKLNSLAMEEDAGRRDDNDEEEEK
jgi:hypothetical protein